MWFNVFSSYNYEVFFAYNQIYICIIFFSRVRILLSVLCWNDHQLLSPSSPPSFCLSFYPSFLSSFPSLFAFCLFPFGFSQEHLGLKPFSFWEKPKGIRQKAKGRWRGRRRRRWRWWRWRRWWRGARSWRAIRHETNTNNRIYLILFCISNDLQIKYQISFFLISIFKKIYTISIPTFLYPRFYCFIPSS